ncbi:SPOSA6832_03571, partial [Sporobolomyces salmonicolor]
MAIDEDDPFTASSSTSGLLAPAKASHRPSLTTLLNTTDISAATDAQPVDLPTAPPLSHELFEGEHFDASEFLLSRRHTGLEELRSELRAYLATLRTSLVGVINEEYEAFIGLSLGLRHRNVATSLSTIRRPVLSIRGEVTRVKGELDEMRDEMASVLEERKEVREMKAVMRRLLATEEAVEKVEGLLKMGDSDKTSKPRDVDQIVDSPAKRLERIAAEYNHMLYLVSRAGDLPFVRSLDDRISRITSALQLDLSQLLTSILSFSPTPSSSIETHKLYRDELTTAMRTFSSLGLVSQAEDIIRRIVVRPFVVKTVHRDALNELPAPVPSIFPHPSSSNADARNALASDDSVPAHYRIAPIDPLPASRDGDFPPLVVLYNSILSFVSRECGVVLDVAERTLASSAASASSQLAEEVRKKGDDGAAKVEGFEILTNVILDEVATKLMGELGTVIFAAGRPLVFHQNYLLTTAFLSRLESLCPSVPHLNSLRSHPSYTSLLKRFQLPVYFHLRFKDAVSSIERAFEVGQASGGGETFVMSESEALFRALRRCWDDDIISRYRTWVNEKVPRYVLPASSSSANLSAMAVGAPPSRSSFDGDRGRLTPSTGNTRPGTPTVGEDVSEETTLRQLTVLVADSRLMEKKVAELFSERIQTRLPGEDPSQPGSAANIMRESLSFLTSIVPSLSSQITTILVKRCAEHLKLVRASTRKGASEPSYFVHNILKELRAYLAGPARVVEEELRSNYAAILSTQKKTEDSLRWLKKGRQGLSFFGRAASSTADDGSTDDDRVKMQMQLDVETLSKDAQALGVDVDRSEAFRGLRKATVGAEEEKK